jgi:hypothetical protein
MKRTGVVTGAVLAGALLGAGPALAATPGPMILDFTSGMVGLALGQVARINAVNITAPPGAINCVVELNFFDADGVAIHPEPKLHDLEPGHAAFLDLPFDELPPPSPEAAGFQASARARTPFTRAIVRADVRATCGSTPGPIQSDADAPDAVNAFAPVQLTIEVFDAETGRASVMVGTGPIQLGPGPHQ